MNRSLVSLLLLFAATLPAAWSPDSRWLAFRWNDRSMPFRDLWIVRADGTGLR